MGTHFVEDVNTVSIFGKTNSENLTFFNHEQQEKKKKFLQAKEQREKETERQQLEDEKRTKEYEEFAMQEKIRQNKGNTRRDGRFYKPPTSAGRGSFLSGSIHESIRSRGDIKPIGRGRLSPLEKQCLPLFERASKVQKNIDQHTESSLHNNKVQKVLWQGLPDEDDDFKATFIPEDYKFSPVDPSPTCDQFEDALSSSQSTSPHSFKSVHSHAGLTSPMTLGLLSQHPPAASNQTLQSQPRLASSSSVIRPWKSSKRMAAKFTNDYVEDDVYNENSCDEQKCIPEEAIGAAGGKKENYEDAGAYLESSKNTLMPSWNSRRTTGTSFNNLSSSRRVLSNDVLRPGQVFYERGGGPNSFNLNMKDFPPL